MELIHDQLTCCTVKNSGLYLPMLHICFLSFLPAAQSQFLLLLDLKSLTAVPPSPPRRHPGESVMVRAGSLCPHYPWWSHEASAQHLPDATVNITWENLSQMWRHGAKATRAATVDYFHFITSADYFLNELTCRSVYKISWKIPVIIFQSQTWWCQICCFVPLIIQNLKTLS